MCEGDAQEAASLGTAGVKMSYIHCSSKLWQHVPIKLNIMTTVRWSGRERWGCKLIFCPRSCRIDKPTSVWEYCRSCYYTCYFIFFNYITLFTFLLKKIKIKKRKKVTSSGTQKYFFEGAYLSPGMWVLSFILSYKIREICPRNQLNVTHYSGVFTTWSFVTLKHVFHCTGANHRPMIPQL